MSSQGLYKSSHQLINRLLAEHNIEPNSIITAKLNDFMAKYTTHLLKETKHRSQIMSRDRENKQIIPQDIIQVILDRNSKQQEQIMLQKDIENKNQQTGKLLPIECKDKKPIFGGIKLPQKKTMWNLSTNQYLRMQKPQKVEDQQEQQLQQEQQNQKNGNQDDIISDGDSNDNSKGMFEDDDDGTDYDNIDNDDNLNTKRSNPNKNQGNQSGSKKLKQ